MRSASALTPILYGPSSVWSTFSLNSPISSWRALDSADAKPKSSVAVDRAAPSQFVSASTHIAGIASVRIWPKNSNSSSSTWSGSPQFDSISIFQKRAIFAWWSAASNDTLPGTKLVIVYVANS